MELRPFLAFSLYEMALFVLAGRVVVLSWPSGRTVRPSLLALWTLAAKLYLGALLAVFILMFVPDRVTGFRVAAVVLAIAAIAASFARNSRPSIVSAPWRLGERILVVAIAAGVGLSMASAAAPMNEFDSLHTFNFLIRWLTEPALPYEFAFDYVSFWEASFVPGLILGQSRNLHIWLSAQAFLLYSLALYVLASRVDLPRSVCLSIVAAAAFLPWHWGFASGVPTIKNDMIANAGFLLALGILVGLHKGERADWKVGIAFGIALGFMTVKYSGPLVAVMLIIAAAAIVWLRDRAAIRSALPMLGVAIAVAVIGTGHYFVKNLVLHGNPLYPFVLSLGLLVLPGYMDVRGTSILNHLGEVRTWKLLFGMDAAAQPQMVLMRLAMVAPFAMIVVALIRRQRSNSDITLVAMLAIAGWLVWSASFWSAGTVPGNWIYLEGLPSFRYATGALGASLVVLAALLIRMTPLPAAAFCLLCVVDAGVQLATLFTKFRPIEFWISPSTLTLAAGVAVTILAAVWSAWTDHRKTRLAAALLATVGTLALVPGIDFVARQQPDFFVDLRSFVATTRPSKIILHKPQSITETSYFGGLGYHLLQWDVPAMLRVLAVRPDAPPAIPQGRDGDLIVMHAIAPDDARFFRYKAQFDERVAGTGWMSVYSDRFSTAYAWKQTR